MAALLAPFHALAERLLTDADDLALARRLGLATGAAAPRAMLDLCCLIGRAGAPGAVIAALDEMPAADAATTVGQLVVHAFAAVRADHASQPDAARARARLAARAEAAYPAIGAAIGYAALDWTVQMVGQASIELSRIAAARAPLVRVETGISLPSSTVAYDLYGDPSRGGEIADRNACGTSMLLPVAIEAVGA